MKWHYIGTTNYCELWRILGGVRATAEAAAADLANAKPETSEGSFVDIITTDPHSDAESA